MPNEYTFPSLLANKDCFEILSREKTKKSNFLFASISFLILAIVLIILSLILRSKQSHLEISSYTWLNGKYINTYKANNTGSIIFGIIAFIFFCLWIFCFVNFYISIISVKKLNLAIAVNTQYDNLIQKGFSEKDTYNSTIASTPGGMYTITYLSQYFQKLSR